MSELRVDSVKSKGGGAPDLPKGVTISGITTAVTLGATQIDVSNVNVSGVVTSGTLSGDLLSTGTPTLGLGVTINSSGLVVSGVATAGIVSATTLYGDGTNITGVGASIAPLFYNPDPGDTLANVATGIGITFNSQVKAGTGNVTLSIANAGVAGTVVENFGVGSSVTISENRITIDPTADLTAGGDYIISYPSGCFTNNEGTDYVGTAYTFQSKPVFYQAWIWGHNERGQLGQNIGGNPGSRSSPVQIPGNNWSGIEAQKAGTLALTNLGTLWAWGRNNQGQLGQNDLVDRSSPTQIPGTTWGGVYSGNYYATAATKTDGTLWTWGQGTYGQTGHNDQVSYSSPVQIPGTEWAHVECGETYMAGTKTTGELWMWGWGYNGQLGQNQGGSPGAARSSPVQVPGTTWGGANKSAWGYAAYFNIKTDGTLWAWGYNTNGELGQNNKTSYSSPIQIPGSTWSSLAGFRVGAMATKTDGTLWTWGKNNAGQLGQNNTTNYSSPVQIPGTTWSKVGGGDNAAYAIKTDGTLWLWGDNYYGSLGQGNTTYYSSPVQIPGTEWTYVNSYTASGNGQFTVALKQT